MSNKIIIKVIGPAKSGRSTVAELIQHALKQAEIPATVQDLDRPGSDLAWRLSALRQRETAVEVAVVLSNREGKLCLEDVAEEHACRSELIVAIRGTEVTVLKDREKGLREMSFDELRKRLNDHEEST